MTITIRAHFDGKVIVPDEPVNLPVHQPLEGGLKLLQNGEERSYEELSIEERIQRYKEFSGSLSGPSVPLEALRRENLYED